VPARKEVVPARKEVVSARKEVVPARKEVVPARKEVVPARKEVVSARKEVVPARKVFRRFEPFWQLLRKVSQSSRRFFLLNWRFDWFFRLFRVTVSVFLLS
jgi:hypothetical protein